MNVDISMLDICPSKKWGISRFNTQKKHVDMYESDVTSTIYSIYKIMDDDHLEKFYTFYYEDNYNTYAEIQEYIGIRLYKWITDSVLYLESVEGDKITIDLDKEKEDDIKKLIDDLVKEIRLF